MNKIDKELLLQIADLHKIPNGSFNIRKNGESIQRASTAEIQIVSKIDKSGIDVFVKDGAQNKSVHIPVIVTQAGLEDVTYNDFHIGKNCNVTIVAGCGIHNTGKQKSAHNGVHTIIVDQNSTVTYIEKHLAIGNNQTPKELSPTTKIILKKSSTLNMQTVQLGGVTYSNRVTTARLAQNAKLLVQENVLTTQNDAANSRFKVVLQGKNSSAEIVSRSVAKDNSKQKFVSNLVGKAACYGRVECDGIITGNAQMASIPQITAQNADASLVHEASIGKIAGEQLTKLMSLGLTKEQAEDMIIKGFLN